MADRELDELRAEAEELGVNVDGRWGVDRLREEIGKALDDDGEPADAAETEPEQQKAEPVGRAGGYVNRDDGAGWVLENGD